MIILASKSPRRSFILSEAGFKFVVKHIEVDESYPDDLLKGDVAMYLSRKKAEHYTDVLGNDDILICADTIVCVDDLILNKPVDFKEACDMLEILSGRMHEVYTGVTLKKNNTVYTFCERTQVFFIKLTPEMIRNYVEKHRPYDKAGAYGIQEGIGYTGIEKISGCYYNVMGMPVSRLFRELEQFDPLILKTLNLD